MNDAEKKAIAEQFLIGLRNRKLGIAAGNHGFALRRTSTLYLGRNLGHAPSFPFARATSIQV